MLKIILCQMTTLKLLLTMGIQWKLCIEVSAMGDVKFSPDK